MASRGQQSLFSISLIFVLHSLIHLTVSVSDNLHVSNQDVHTFQMLKQSENSPLVDRIKRSVLDDHIDQNLVRKKRDTKSNVDPTCQAQEKDFLSDIKGKADFVHVHQFNNETKFTMSLVWAGKNDGVIIVVVTEEQFIFALPSTVYRSADHGKNWDTLNSKINNAIIRKGNGLQKHLYEPNYIFLVAHTRSSKSDLYISADGGKNFEKVSLPFMLDGQIYYHPSKDKDKIMMTVSQASQKLYISKDKGKSWSKIMDSVKSAKWTTDKNDPAGTIYAVEDPLHASWVQSMLLGQQGVYQLKKSTDYGATWTVIHKETVTFGMEGKFLYASVKADGGQNQYSRLMVVSTNGGDTWAETQLPTLEDDRFYSILDMSENLIFMHVDDPDDTGHGTLYTSDGSGVIFSQSLQFHLYPNGLHDLTDFYKVKSMRGVYLASQMEKDNSIHTMITFDRGAVWQKVNRPIGVPCKDESKECYLQIHNRYSNSRGIPSDPPLSSENAKGIIMVHGQVADTLQTAKPDVFVSSDGGYTWVKSLEGPHHYQIADNGGILVAVSMSTSTPNVVKFSTDEGRCWHEYKFTNETFFFTGLLTEPGSKAMTVSLWGFDSDHKWRVYVIDFEQIITRQCDRSKDYEPWIPHWGNSNEIKMKGCVLGQQETMNRLKKDSWCKNGYEYETMKSTTVCPCTKDDYECDYGYYRKVGSDECKLDPKFKGNALDICLRGHEEKIVTVGYRKIPGDKCNGGYSAKKKKVPTATLR